jgi:hypothetical protein
MTSSSDSPKAELIARTFSSGAGAALVGDATSKATRDSSRIERVRVRTGAIRCAWIRGLVICDLLNKRDNRLCDVEER